MLYYLEYSFETLNNSTGQIYPNMYGNYCSCKHFGYESTAADVLGELVLYGAGKEVFSPTCNGINEN